MRQNFGLFFLTLGSVVLSVNVFWGKCVRSWEELPWEQRLFYKLTGGRKLIDLERQSKMLEEVVKRQNDENYRKRMEKRAKLHSRIIGDLPIVAIVMMITGFFLCLRY
jgi:hypothetical protein